MTAASRPTSMPLVATWRSPLASLYVEEGDWRGELLDDYLSRAAREHPDRTAVIDRERRVSFSELAELVEQGAGMLTKLGVRSGEVVSWQLPNWLEAAVVHYATLRVGAVSNPIVPIYRGRELRYILQEAGSRIFIVPDVFRRFDYRAMVAEMRSGLPRLEHVLVVGEPAAGTTSFATALAAGGRVAAVDRDASDLALLLYTSGTESAPKGVLHTHDSLVYECWSMIDLCAVTDADCILMASPVTHITGILYGLHLPCIRGTSVVLQDVWDASGALDLIERERCSFTVGATPFLHGLVHAPDLDTRDVSSFRAFGCGGADVPPALIRDAGERLGVQATRLYGLTECPTVTGSAVDAPADRRAETDGRPIGRTEARVVNKQEADLPRGERGALLVRGPDLCAGYLDESLNASAFTDDGWFRTGDLAVLDEDGYVRIAGRAKDVIVRGGENISAKEIEDLLIEHSAIDDVAVVGYPDNVLGERICAVVVGEAQLTLEQVVAFLGERQIAKQKFPERLIVVGELPKTASGKIQKARLRAQINAGLVP